MDQKRRHPRHDTILYLQVYSSPDREPIARLIDISTDGALLLSESPFPLDASFDAIIELPRLDSKETTEITCTLTPRWHKPDYNPDLTLNGCAMEVKSGNYRRIEEFMRDYGFGGEISDVEDLREEEE